MSDEDDDYMSFNLEALPAASAPAPSRRRGADAAAGAATAPPPRKSARAVLEEGLAQPIPESNIGFKLLAKMGYKPPTAAGATDDDATPTRARHRDPITVVLKSDRTGLGVVDPSAVLSGRNVPAPGAEHKETPAEAREREAREAEARSAFLRSRGAQFESRRVRGQLRKARAVRAQLDDALGLAKPAPPTSADPNEVALDTGADDEDQTLRPRPGHELGEVAWDPSDEDEDDDDQDGQSDDDQDGQSAEGHPAPASRAAAVEEDEQDPTTALDAEVQALRGAPYWYCFWCSARYEGEDDLARHCPGPAEADHD